MRKATATTLIDRLLPSTVCFPWGVCLLHIHKTQNLSAWRQTTYDPALWTKPSIILHPNIWLPATWLVLSNDESPPLFPMIALQLYIWSQNHKTISGSLLFDDGSYKQNFQRQVITHVAIVFQHETLEAYSLPTVKVVHMVELMVLTRTYTLAEGNIATIYIDIYTISFWTLPCCWHNMEIPWILNCLKALLWLMNM